MYLPLHGFADSLNLSVATAMVLQRLFMLDPSLVGSVAPSEMRELRQRFYPKMGRSDAQREAFRVCAEDVNAGILTVVPFGDLRRPEQHRVDQCANVT